MSPRSPRRSFHAFVQVAAVAAVAFTTRASFADHYVVPTGSMEPTVAIGDHILVNKAAYGVRLPLTERWMLTFDGPARGDVVVLEADQPVVLLKRVVATGGDRVEVKDGRVYIDGAAAVEPAVPGAPGDGGPDFGPERVPAGKLLVLGDNRGNSRDGRTFGFVDERRVLGRAVAVIAHGGTPAYSSLR